MVGTADMIRTYDFLAPSLHPNTLVDISIPEPGPSGPSSDPVVRNLPIVYGEHQAIGTIKRLAIQPTGDVIVADDAYRISTLSLEESDDGKPRIPNIIDQYTVKHRSGDTWSGLVTVQAGTISALTSGQLTLHPHASSSTRLSRSVSSPLLALSSSASDATSFALVGKEVDVSIWDVERTFASSSLTEASTAGGKRKKGELEAGEVWRAKNMPNTSLALRPPNHHLCLAHLSSGPSHLVSGTKSGTIRRFDTRQRKPVNEWKVAREGGIGAIAQGQDEHEVYFADRANLVGAADLRTGRVLYTYANVTSTTHHLLAIPPTSPDTTNIRLATIASDATLRLHSTLPPKAAGEKGNLGGGRKAKVEGMVGGVGIGTFLWSGFGEIAAPAKQTKRAREEGEEGDDDEESDEEVWEGMSEVEDGDASDDDEESEDDVPVTNKRSKK